MVLDANGTDADVTVQAAITSGSGGAVTITADDSVSFTSNGDITSSGSGTVSVTSNTNTSDGNSGDGITMANGTLFDAGSGTIVLQATGGNGGSIAIGGLKTTNANATSSVSISTVAAVTDAGDTDVDVISGGRLVISSATGAGSGDSLETTIVSLNALNSTSGSIQIAESTGLTIFKAEQSAGAGNVQIVTTDGTITVDNGGAATNAVITKSTGTITLNANGSDKDLLINDGITSVSGAIDLDADDDIIFEAPGDITSTSGNVSVTADSDNSPDGTGGALTMVDQTVINAGTGTITLEADEDIKLGRLVTTSSSTVAVTITTVSGGVIDNGDTGSEDIDATNGRVVIDAKNGVGSTVGVGDSDLETDAGSLDIDNTTTGDIKIDETDEVTVIQLDNDKTSDSNAATGVIVLVAGGAITVANSAVADWE
ncbi:MAG: hypothetical protein JKY23_02745 [Nitrospinaceae bacterium]|nr:hypothetical protein [Nitrospinaceae bacterium]